MRCPFRGLKMAGLPLILPLLAFSVLSSVTSAAVVASNNNRSLPSSRTDLLESVVVTRGHGVSRCDVIHRNYDYTLCKLHDVIYMPGEMSWFEKDHYPGKGQGNITLHVRRGDQTLQKPSKLATADGEVALTFVDYDRASLLEGRGGLGMDNFVYYDLVVVWIRGYNNLWHWTYEQMWPTYLMLRHWNLSDRSAVLMALNNKIWLDKDVRSSDGKSKGIPTTTEDLFLGGSVDWALHAGRGFKAHTMIIGDAGVQWTIHYTEWPGSEYFNWLKPLFLDFSSWIHRRLNASFPDHPPFVSPKDGNISSVVQRPIVVTFVARPEGHYRRMVNMEEVMKHLRSRYNIIANMEKLEDFSLAQQVQLVAQSDVLFAMHGAAQTHLMHLPPWGVVVELFAYQHGSNNSKDFRAGYCNLAQITAHSHIGWHNRNQAHSIEPSDGHRSTKDRSMYLPLDQAEIIMDAAIRTVMTPLDKRNLSQCIRLNEPVE